MDFPPSINRLLEQLEQLRQQKYRLIQKRDELFREMDQLASRQAELKALLDAERVKLKKP